MEKEKFVPNILIAACIEKSARNKTRVKKKTRGRVAALALTLTLVFCTRNDWIVEPTLA